jgi:hypothetical protein
MAAKIQISSNLGEICFPSRFWCWELIFMVWEPYYDPLCRNIHRSMWQLLGVEKFGFQVDYDVANWYSSLVGRHSKPTMNINSQHHNLLGIQISPKSEDFCIWRPFCTLVTMATVAILIFSTHQKLPHTVVDIPTKFHEVWWKESNFVLNTPFLFPWQPRQCLSNRFRFVWLISFH